MTGILNFDFHNSSDIYNVYRNATRLISTYLLCELFGLTQTSTREN